MEEKQNFDENSNSEEKNNISNENKNSKTEKKGIFKKTDKKEEKIKELEKQIEELRNDYLRSRADFENFRKRKEKEIIETKEKAVVNFVLDLLPSIDNFEMSLKMTDNKEMFIRGVEMINQNLHNLLEENKFKSFMSKPGEKFDPYMHEPVLIEDKTKEPGTIITVLQKGYMFKDKIIRPVRVQVIKDEETSTKNEDKKEDNNK